MTSHDAGSLAVRFHLGGGAGPGCLGSQGIGSPVGQVTAMEWGVADGSVLYTKNCVTTEEQFRLG